jgi:hypothetical protein
VFIQCTLNAHVQRAAPIRAMVTGCAVGVLALERPRDGLAGRDGLRHRAWHVCVSRRDDPRNSLRRDRDGHVRQGATIPLHGGPDILIMPVSRLSSAVWREWTKCSMSGHTRRGRTDDRLYPARRALVHCGGRLGAVDLVEAPAGPAVGRRGHHQRPGGPRLCDGTAKSQPPLGEARFALHPGRFGP